MGMMYLPPQQEGEVAVPLGVDTIRLQGLQLNSIGKALTQVHAQDYYGFVVRVTDDRGIGGVLLFIPDTDTLFNNLKDMKEKAK